MPYKILIVDDQPRDLRYLLAHLETAKMDCRICRKGRDAVRAFNSEHFDLILLDVMMGGGDDVIVAEEEDQGAEGDDQGDEDEDNTRFGLRLYRYMRRKASWRVPIIILTAFAGEGWLDEWLKRQQQTDPRMTVLNKQMLPPQIYAVILDKILSGPYYARSTFKETAVELYCEPALDSDRSLIQRWDHSRCVFRETLIHYVLAPPLRRHTFALRKYTELQTGEIHGIVYTAGDHTEDDWSFHVLFESAPQNKYGASDRELRRIGLICVARLVRESQLRGQRGELSLHGGSASSFLESIGFKKLSQGRQIYFLDSEPAMTILEMATR